MMALQKESAIIRGKAFWTKLNRKDEFSEKYQMDVGNLAEKSKDVLISHGVHLKNKEDDRGEFITARSKWIVPIMDTEKQLIDNDVLIGNGSDVKVKVTFNKNHPFSEKHGTSMYLTKVQVVNLVTFSNDDDDSDFDDDDDLV